MNPMATIMINSKPNHRLDPTSRAGLAALVIGFALMLAPGTLRAQAQEPETGGQYKVTNYSIDATLFPPTHTLTATVKITFTPQIDLTAIDFKLDSGLRVRSVLGPTGQAVQFSQQGLALAVSLLNPLPANSPTTLTVQYAGLLETADGSPVEGLKLANVGPEGSYLLYPSCWFPVNGAGFDRFSATLHITVPQGETVIASGDESGPVNSPAGDTYTFQYDRASFPGTVIAGPYVAQSSMAGGVKLTVYMKQGDAKYAGPYAAMTDKILAFYAQKFGTLPVNNLDVVEIDNDTLGGYSGPGFAAIAARGFTEPVDANLLAHEIAHQWWPCLVSPVTPNDDFLSDGLSTYSAAMFIQQSEGETAFEDRMQSVAIGALTHENVAPIAQAGTLQPFSPEYQSVAFDKGAMVLHMLRSVIKDPAFFDTLKAMAHDYAWKTITTDQFQKLAETAGKQRLTYFFAQWVDSTGVPQFKRQWAIYRTQTGYQVVGKLQQDLDIFRMPIDVRVYVAGGRPVNQVVEMVGTTASFTIDTKARPLQVEVDPANDVLKYTASTRIQVEMARADQLTQETEYFAAIAEYRKVLQENPNNSLAHYRIGDILLTLRNYNAALESFQDALNGNLNPKWVEVWSYLKIGEIFDATGQRDRALNEYNRALHTNDNTQGALTLANEYIKKPYSAKPNQAGGENS